jgi:hypothetical protein
MMSDRFILSPEKTGILTVRFMFITFSLNLFCTDESNHSEMNVDCSLTDSPGIKNGSLIIDNLAVTHIRSQGLLKYVENTGSRIFCCKKTYKPAPEKH